MFGLGKRRSKFGSWLDRRGISQRDVAKKAKLSDQTISRLCNSNEESPKISTWVKVQKALNSMGYNADYDDFWM
jgi:transcriptional regulator with XRE-family HTH domain